MWRSLVARVVRDDEVAGSNPVIPTKHKEGPPHGGSSFVCPVVGPARFHDTGTGDRPGPGPGPPDTTQPREEISRGCAGYPCRRQPAVAAPGLPCRACYIGLVTSGRA